jgi:hypothetical protein
MPRLSWNEVRNRAIHFSRNWSEATSERADKQTFYNEFFDVFGIRRASVAAFETNVRNLHGHTNAIDLLWRGKLIVEHKSRGASLEQAETQAFGYIEDLTRENRFDEVPRFVLVSDFANFVLYDLEPEEQRNLPLFAGRPFSRLVFSLRDFPRNIRAFAFMLGQTRVRLDPEDPANEKAYGRMCELHDALKIGGFSRHDLERLLVRILFCVFAEDTGIFEPESFTSFIRQQTREDGSDLGAQLNMLFDWLNDERAENRLEDTDPLYGFRYVNGGLFAERLGFAHCNRAMRNALIECCAFHWARISPAVFGSLFQGVIDDRARRQQGAHYTSERDIMKVIRSLFLDELRAEFEQLQRDRSTRQRANIETFHQKLRSLNFLDPACGCGNFLVLGYREMRQLEIEVIRELHGTEQQALNVRDLCKVDVDQFYGIEYSEWPVRIAEVAMWLMDHQMNAQAAEAFGQRFERLPLRASPHVIQGNALRTNWNTVLPHEQCSFVLGNPPFVGHQWRNVEQQDDMARVWGENGRFGRLDYVTCWFRRAAEYISGTTVKVGFVATNSISQGEQVGILWADLFAHRIAIDFAHRSFNWASEARGAAQVDVVIIGFSLHPPPTRRLYDYDADEAGIHATVTECANISPYLVIGPNLVLPSRTEPRAGFPQMKKGSQPTDGGYLILTESEKNELLSNEPDAEPWLRPFVGGDELIQSTHRWCLWLKAAPPNVLRRLPCVMERVAGVRESRLRSPTPQVRAYAEQPTLFTQDRQPDAPFIAVPEVSSENRRYIPIAFLQPTIIASNKLQIIVGGNIYHFGVLNSGIHMAWVRVVSGRLESRLSYAPSVYNNFPWPNPTPEQRERVEDKAQAVLDARTPHLPPRGLSTLADLYDPNTMPPELQRAHTQLDRAVERCYRAETFQSDRERVEHLFRLSEQLTAPLLPATPRTRGRRQQIAATTPRPRRGRTPGLPSQAD